MTTLRPFRVNDIFKFNRVNLDPLTETYGIGFYFHYLARWPEYFNVGRRVIKKNKNVLHQIEISHKIEFSQNSTFHTISTISNFYSSNHTSFPVTIILKMFQL